MFKFIIGQERLKEQLNYDFTNQRIPSAFLIFGEPFIGKFSIALELARIITCTADPHLDECSCASCRMHKELLHPNLFLLGNRYFQQEIAATFKTLQAYIIHDKPIPESVKLFSLRNLHKLIRRFDTPLWDKDDGRYKEAKTLVPSLHETVNDVFRSNDALTLESLSKLEAKVIEVSQILDGYAVNIGQIRSTLHHCMTLSGQKRVVIIEEAHLMQESARNALLKQLEEPQENLYFILLTTHKEEIMPTILSRLRAYQALPLAPIEEQSVLQKIFRNSQTVDLKELLSPVSPQIITELSKRFLLSVQQNQSIYSSFSETENALLYRYIKELLMALKKEIIHDNLTMFMKNKLLNKMEIIYFGYKEYNQNPEIILYSLYQQFFQIYKSMEKI